MVNCILGGFFHLLGCFLVGQRTKLSEYFISKRVVLTFLRNNLFFLIFSKLDFKNLKEHFDIVLLTLENSLRHNFGRLMDRFRGKNVYQVCVAGIFEANIEMNVNLKIFDNPSTRSNKALRDHVEQG
jgi:hypothetical protein